MTINSSSNRILVEMRESWRTEGSAYHEGDMTLCADRFLLSCVEEPAAAERYSQKERDDAGRVLTRIIRIAEGGEA